MNSWRKHFQSKFVAGLLAAVPIAVTVFLVVYVDSMIRRVVPLRYPLLGIIASLGLIYVLGLFVTSLFGRYVLHLFDGWLTRLPGLRDFYRTWKQLLVAPDADSGMFARVVAIPDESGLVRMVGFSSGRPIDAQSQHICVFVPNSPNPISGRLYLVGLDQCRFLDLPTREALKFIISGGNHTPAALGSSFAPPSVAIKGK